LSSTLKKELGHYSATVVVSTAVVGLAPGIFGLTPVANAAIVSCNASAVKVYNAVQRYVLKTKIFSSTFKNAQAL
jgi:hypothetical protein